MPWRQLERTGFYNDFVKPAGIKGVCAAIVSDGSNESMPIPVLMSFYREPGVRYANRRALSIMDRNRISIRDNRLRSGETALTEKLSAAVKQGASGIASLVKIKESQWLCGRVPTGGLSAERNLIIALISDGARRTPLAHFAAGHGLTRAETRLLEGLLQKHGDPKRLAAQFGIAVSTVRTQLRSIYLKTGTRGQRDLIQKILALPPSLID